MPVENVLHDTMTTNAMTSSEHSATTTPIATVSSTPDFVKIAMEEELQVTPNLWQVLAVVHFVRQALWLQEKLLQF